MYHEFVSNPGEVDFDPISTGKLPVMSPATNHRPIAGGCRVELYVELYVSAFGLLSFPYFVSHIPIQSASPRLGSQLSLGSSTHFPPSMHGLPAIPPHACFFGILHSPG